MTISSLRFNFIVLLFHFPGLTFKVFSSRPSVRHDSFQREYVLSLINRNQSRYGTGTNSAGLIAASPSCLVSILFPTCAHMTRDPTDRDVVASQYRFMHLIHQSVQEMIVFFIVVDRLYRTHRVIACNIITVRSIINNPQCESNIMQFGSHYTCNNRKRYLDDLTHYSSSSYSLLRLRAVSVYNSTAGHFFIFSRCMCLIAAGVTSAFRTSARFFSTSGIFRTQKNSFAVM